MRHQSHRADFDITVLERGTDEKHKSIPSESTRIRFQEPLLDKIFSKRFHDLHELPRFGVIAKAVAELSDNRKEALFLKLVKKYTEKEIAEYKGVSQSSISQLYKKSINHIRNSIRQHINRKLYHGNMLLKSEIRFYIDLMWPLKKAS